MGRFKSNLRSVPAYRASRDLTLGKGQSSAVPTYAEILRDTYSADEIWPLVDIALGPTIPAFINSNRDGNLSGWDLQNAVGPVSDTLAPLSDGTTGAGGDYGNIYSSNGSDGLDDIWDGDTGSVFVWGRVQNAGIWTDGSVRQLLYIEVDGNNLVSIYKDVSAAPTRMVTIYKAGGTTKQTYINVSTTDWFSMGLSWDKNAGATGEVKAFLNGVQQGATLTNLGVWAGVLDSQQCAIGSSWSITGVSVWKGWFAYVALRVGAVWEPADFLAMHNAAATATGDCDRQASASFGDMEFLGFRDTPERVVVPCGANGESDYKIREIGNILYEPDDTGYEYKFTYTGYSGGPGSTDQKIHYAYSSDGKSWTKSPSNPVISDRTAEDPYVVKNGDTYYLFAEDKEAGNDRIRRWHSTNFVDWVDDGQIDILNCQSPCVWIEGSTWYILYENYPVEPWDMRLATSSDGLNWTEEPTNPVMSPGDAGWSTISVVIDDIRNTYEVTYHGQAGVDELTEEAIATSTNLTTWVDGAHNPVPEETGTYIKTMMFIPGEDVFLYYVSDSLGVYRGKPGKVVQV